MLQFLKNNILAIAGVITGSIAGFQYWKFIGCTSGTCYIQTNPFRMTLYGAGWEDNLQYDSTQTQPAT